MSYGAPVPGNAHLSAGDRAARIAMFHAPYWDAVRRDVAARLRDRGACLHLSSHSFDPTLDPAQRTFEVGVLYDPAHAFEAELAERLMFRLRARRDRRPREPAVQRPRAGDLHDVARPSTRATATPASSSRPRTRSPSAPAAARGSRPPCCRSSKRCDAGRAASWHDARVAPVLALAGLGKDYGDRRAVDAVDLEIEPGMIVGLLGPNGAGKTTTISMICGVVAPTRGTAKVDGHDVSRAALAAKRALGLVPQDLAIYDELTRAREPALLRRLYGLAGAELAARIDWALGVAGLADRADEPVRRSPAA